MRMQETWTELSSRLDALALKLELHFAQTRDGQAQDTLGKLREGVEEAFEAAGNAVHDTAVRADVREVGRLVADAVTTALSRVGAEVRDTVGRRD